MAENAAEWQLGGDINTAPHEPNEALTMGEGECLRGDPILGKDRDTDVSGTINAEHQGGGGVSGGVRVLGGRVLGWGS